MGLRRVIAGIKIRVRGRDFWRTLNRIIGIGLYTVIIVGIMVFPQYLMYVFFGMAVIVPSYVALFIDHLRKMEKRGKGNKLIEGWITHAYGVGERVYFYPTKFELVDKLSPDDLKSVKQYVEELKEQSKKLGLEGFKKEQPKPSKQLEYKKIEDMNKKERMSFDEEEKLEHESYVSEFKKIIVIKPDEKKKETEIVVKQIKGNKKNPVIKQEKGKKKRPPKEVEQ